MISVQGQDPACKDVSLHDEMYSVRPRPVENRRFPQSLSPRCRCDFRTSPICWSSTRRTNNDEKYSAGLEAGSETAFTWKLHTAYAVNEAPQLRPDAPGKWHGRIKASEHAEERVLHMVV